MNIMVSVRLFCGIALICLAALATGAVGDGEDTTLDPSVVKEIRTIDDLAAYVSQAAEYARNAGKEAAVAEFSDRNGSYVRDDLYIYAYEMDGTLLAHPFEEEQVGTNRLNWTAADGMRVIECATDVVSDGGGYFLYMYPRPVEGITTINESALSAYRVKIGYALPVDDDWWIASGMYLSDLERDSGASTPPLVTALLDFVLDARDYARDTGREDALAAFNDPEGAWTNGSLYIYALDYNGTLLAQPYDQEYLGTDHSGIVRTYGVKSVEQAARIARDGGGLFVYYITDPVSGEEEGKLSSVLPVDDDWYIGSGIYLDELVKSLEDG